MTHNPGSGGIVLERPTVQIWWDVGDTPENTPVTIEAENAETRERGIKLDRNDGTTNLTYPAGTKLKDKIRVFETDNPDNVIAEFEIDVHVQG